jgi:hypothetical protein
VPYCLAKRISNGLSRAMPASASHCANMRASSSAASSSQGQGSWLQAAEGNLRTATAKRAPAEPTLAPASERLAQAYRPAYGLID